MEVTQLPLLEKLYLDNNKLLTLPPELGGLKNLKVLAVDYNLLASVPGKIKLYVAYNVDYISHIISRDVTCDCILCY